MSTGVDRCRVTSPGLIALSPDGRRLAWAGPGDSPRTDIRVVDIDRGAVIRLTHDGVNTSPVWSPDGRRLFVARRDRMSFQLAAIDTDTGRIVRPALSSASRLPGVGQRGRPHARVRRRGRGTKRDVWIVDTAGGPPRPIVQSPFDETAPAVSPDGTLVAYQSDEAGRWDVYVQRIADGRRTIVSTNGGDLPALDAGRIGPRRSGPETALLRAPVRKDTLAVGAAERVGDIGARPPRRLRTRRPRCWSIAGSVDAGTPR